jgi:uncharacterized membrane protein
MFYVWFIFKNWLVIVLIVSGLTSGLFEKRLYAV